MPQISHKQMIEILLRHNRQLRDDLKNSRMQYERCRQQLDEAYEMLNERSDKRGTVDFFKRAGKNIALAVGHIRGLLNIKSL